MLPAPFSCTISVLWVSFGTRCRLIALIVEPQATPTSCSSRRTAPRIRAAERATRSSRSTSLAWSGIGTTCARISWRARISCSMRLGRSSGEWMRDLDESAGARVAEQARDRGTRGVQLVRDGVHRQVLHVVQVRRTQGVPGLAVHGVAAVGGPRRGSFSIIWPPCTYVHAACNSVRSGSRCIHPHPARRRKPTRSSAPAPASRGQRCLRIPRSRSRTSTAAPTARDRSRGAPRPTVRRRPHHRRRHQRHRHVPRPRAPGRRRRARRARRLRLGRVVGVAPHDPRRHPLPRERRVPTRAGSPSRSATVCSRSRRTT